MSESAQGTRMTKAEWLAEAVRRFGKDPMKWKFVCPSCGYVQSTQDYKDAGARSENVGFSCVGRWRNARKEAFGKEGGPCNYAGGGLVRLNPICVVDEDGTELHAFAFAEVSPS